MLRRPLRPRRRRRHRRHAGRAAPAHRAADRQLAVHRRDRAPRQRRQPRDGAARRGQPDDRRARDQPLRGVHRRAPGRCTAPSCGWRCPTATGTPTPGFAHHAPAAGHRRRAGRRGSSSARCSAAPRRSPTYTPLLGAELLLEPGTTLALDVDASFEHGVLVDSGVWHGRRAARPSSTSWPTSRPASARLELDGVRRAGAAAAARRPAVRRGDRDVVELRRPQPRRDRGLPRGVAGARSPATARSSPTPRTSRRPLRDRRRRPPPADPRPRAAQRAAQAAPLTTEPSGTSYVVAAGAAGPDDGRGQTADSDRRGMRGQRRDRDVHVGEQRQARQQVVQLVVAVDVEDADVGVLADDPPQVRPLARALQLLAVGLLAGQECRPGRSGSRSRGIRTSIRTWNSTAARSAPRPGRGRSRR